MRKLPYYGFFFAPLLILLTSSPLLLSAQSSDWHPLPDSLQSFYRNDSLSDHKFLGIGIDSVDTINDEKAYYHPTPIVRDTAPSSFEPCLNPRAGGLLGKGFLRKDSGRFVFLNKEGDSVRLHTQADTGDSWPIYIYPDKDTLIGEVSTIASDSVLSGLDSVKTISLQRVDSSNGNPVPDPINGKRFRIGKEKGLIELPSIFDIPHGDGTYRLFRRGAIRRREIHRKEVGDVFHIDKDGREDNINGIDQEDVRLEVIGKTAFPAQDSVTYRLKRRTVHYDFDPTIGEGYSISKITHDTVQRGYGRLSEPFLDALPYEFIDSSEWEGDEAIRYRMRFGLCGRLHLSYASPSFFFRQTDSCYKEANGEYNSISDLEYGVGLGLTYSSSWQYDGNGSNIILYTKRLTYSDKGGESCGDPLLTVGQEEYEDRKNGFEVRPDPFEDGFVLRTGQQKVKSIRIFDLEGKELKGVQKEGRSEGRIRIGASSLSRGVYILQLRTPKGCFTKKVVKR